jgi:ankyrin repeat protein
VITQSVIHAAPIHDATKSKNTSEVKRLLAQTPNEVNAQDEWGFTPLMYAVRDNQLDLMEMLLEHGARVSLKDTKMRETALDKVRTYLAQCSDEYVTRQVHAWRLQQVGEEQIVERIAAHKERFGDGARSNWLRIETALIAAFEREVATDLTSPLLQAVRQRDSEEVRRLLEKGHLTGVKDAEGRTPLLLAVMQGDAVTAQVLLGHGADMGEPDKQGQTAVSVATQMFQLLVAARREGDYRSVQEKIKKGRLDINAKDGNGETALMRAAAEGRLDDVKSLIQLGARTDVTNNKGESLKQVVCTRARPLQLKEQIVRSIDEANESPSSGLATPPLIP